MARSKKCDSVAGRLKRLITIEEETLTPGSAGGYASSWTSIAQVWAEIKPARVRERLRQDQLHSTSNHVITMRYRDDITTKMRISYEGRIFNITAIINPMEDGELLELMATENVAT